MQTFETSFYNHATFDTFLMDRDINVCIMMQLMVGNWVIIFCREREMISYENSSYHVNFDTKEIRDFPPTCQPVLIIKNYFKVYEKI